MHGDAQETGLQMGIAFYQWWNSESQSNWRDGYVRSAILLDEPEYLEKTREYVDKILSTQDEDGYLGIYDSELRYQFTGENGELWAQSTLFRGLLACYEGLRDESILEKVRKAADYTMERYPKDASHPFDLKEPKGGAGHGLTIVDSYVWLYEITEDKKYLEYAVWLYEDYSEYLLLNRDMQIANLQNPFYFFQEHAAHTFEHMRAVIHAACTKEEHRPLLDMLVHKLPYYLTPSGGPIGDERIHGRTADATWTGYEFCTVQELIATYSLLAEKTGDMYWNDQIEWLYFNAAEGMKHPVDSSIMYLKTDNCYIADGHKHPDCAEYNLSYSYSPTHLKTAMCCVPNMGRCTPYFVQSLLRMTEDGFCAVGYSPYVYRGTYKGVQVCIQQESDYPKELSTCFHIQASESVSFALHLRLPSWAKKMMVNGKTYENIAGMCREIVIEQEWRDDRIEILFEAELQFRTDLKEDTYVTYGPILYALPLPAQEAILKDLEVPGFHDKLYIPQNRKLEKLAIRGEDRKAFRYMRKDAKAWWNASCILGLFTDEEGSKVEMEMVPMARTTLRKITW